MLKFLLAKFFSRIFYPTKRQDWYNIKGYKGHDDISRFKDFLFAQRNKDAIFYNEFKDLNLTRRYIKSKNQKLDSVLISPNQEQSKDKPGYGLYFIMFQGRLEYYESRFRDMAIQARQTGSSVLGFNPKGLNSSTGTTIYLSDIVDDGIAVIAFLLKRGIGCNQIILQGNSLGAAVQDRVVEYYRKTYGMRFRQINSNSFKTISSVIAYRYKMPFFEGVLYAILKYADWDIVPSSDYYKIGPYRCHMRRIGDKTIVPKAEYHVMLDHKRDYDNSPEDYRKASSWLYEHSQMIYKGSSKKDPHLLSLNKFRIYKAGENKTLSVYDFINLYLEASNTNLD